MSERKKANYSIKTILLLVVISILAGIIVFQQVEINNIDPIASQEAKTELAWINLTVSLAISEITDGRNTSLPSLIVLTNAHNNSSCASQRLACDGNNFFFGIQNICTNATYYGTCNFDSVLIYWYDPTNNILFTTTSNASLPQGKLVTIYGNWPDGYVPSWRFPLFIEVSTSGGWAAAAMSVSS